MHATPHNPSAIHKAMLLAAGYGRRLRPLTLTTPKPMIVVGGKPLIDHALTALARAGITDAMINLHHLPDAIRTHVDNGRQYGLRAHCSFEPQLLDTGGGLKNVAAFFGSEPFVLMNADTLIALDLQKLIAAHPSGAVATLVVRRLQPGESYTPLTVDAHGDITQIGSGALHYTGVMIGTKQLLDQLPAGKPSALVTDGLQPLLAAGHRIATLLHTGYWSDIGTPQRLAEARREWAAPGLPK